MAEKRNVNVGAAGDGAKIGYNVTENNQNVQNINVYPATNLQELRELQEKELQERGVYFLLFFYLENVNI